MAKMRKLAPLSILFPTLTFSQVLRMAFSSGDISKYLLISNKTPTKDSKEQLHPVNLDDPMSEGY